MIKFKKKNLSGSSKRWIQRHYNDDLVNKAKKLGYRSRAIFKLEEINNKLSFLNKNKNIIDLGAAPGSWSQYLSKQGFKNLLAIDILEINKLPNVKFILGDFTNEDIKKKILQEFEEIDIILSDIASNTTGNKKLDSFKTNSICLDVLDFASNNLVNSGYVLAKYFNGELDKEIIEFSRKYFRKNKIIKPRSSRKDSKEMYVFAQK
ncbi:MAG: RlmE family RNA methyltransferase [Pelagibacteraceae bacterium]|nr:RlmE family RNA methyltransferase [Pelagibacteraceae bacterium]MCI5079002.1 RlmE family RNA methyltransferase [Pelagibacteraceae bacterium]